MTTTPEPTYIIPILGMPEIILTLVCVVTSLLALMLLYHLFREYNCRKRPSPRTEIFLRFPLNANSLYIHFLTMPDDISCYTFSVSDGPIGWKIFGSIAPKLCLHWPDINIWHTLQKQEIDIPKCIPISRGEASLLFLQDIKTRNHSGARSHGRHKPHALSTTSFTREPVSPAPDGVIR